MSAPQHPTAPPSCRVSECVYVAEPGARHCAMHGALLDVPADSPFAAGKLDQAAGQLTSQLVLQLLGLVAITLVVAIAALVLAVVGVLQ